MIYITHFLDYWVERLQKGGGVLFLLIFLPSLVLAQETYEPYCITEMSSTNDSNYSGSIDPAYLATFPKRNFNIYFWDIQEDNGASSPRLTNDFYTDAVDGINLLFQESGICFTLKGHQEISNSEFYETHHNKLEQLISYTKDQNLYVDNAINVFLFRITSASGRAISEGIAVNKWNFYNDKEGVLAHEIGHFLGLQEHTFYGWNFRSCEHETRDENDPNFNADIRGDKIIDTNPAPDFALEQYEYGKKALASININRTTDITDILNSNGFAQHPRANEIETALADYGFIQDEIDYLKNNPYKKYAYLDEDAPQYIGVPRPNSNMFKNCEGIPFVNILTPDDIGNVMGYTRNKFMNNFSVGQAIHMQETIEISSNTYIHSTFTNYDLFIRNSEDDIGTEPDLNTSNENLWNSPDIWVRKSNDGYLIQEHQEPIYIPNHTNQRYYVYVRISNRSCTDYDGSDAELELTWSKANILNNLLLQNLHLDNSIYFNNLIDKVDIPPIQAGESIILKIPWIIPNPADFNDFQLANAIDLNWGYNLYAKINSDSDILHSTSQLGMFKYNNNIAAKSIHIIDMNSALSSSSQSKLPGSIIGVGNYLGEDSQVFNYKFSTGQNANLWKEAEVIITMDDFIWNKWEQTNFMSENIKVFNKEAKQAIITNDNAKLKNLYFNPGEWGVIHIGINFLTQKVEQEYFDYIISQEDTENNTVANTTIKIIRDNTRNLFKAEADYEWSTHNEAYVLKAMNIHEDAKYNWYSPEGNLIASNMESILPIHAKGTYTLEVISEDDSYKDYDEIEISNIYGITSISPNPATTQANITYKTPNLSTETVQISINALHGGKSDTFQANGGEISLDFSNYNTGIYSISLIYDNEIIDSKNIIIN